jgi:hypothetical protein
MRPIYKSALLAVLHVSLVCTLGAKLLYDRAHRPRIWIKSAIYDPNLPIRGKYLSLTMQLPAEGFTSHTQTLLGDTTQTYENFSPTRCDLVLRGDQLIAVGNEEGQYWANIRRQNQTLIANINGETAYFLPEHSSGPLLRTRGEELWIEATIPRKGPPRPIRLGIKKNGVLTPFSQE